MGFAMICVGVVWTVSHFFQKSFNGLSTEFMTKKSKQQDELARLRIKVRKLEQILGKRGSASDEPSSEDHWSEGVEHGNTGSSTGVQSWSNKETSDEPELPHEPAEQVRPELATPARVSFRSLIESSMEKESKSDQLEDAPNPLEKTLQDVDDEKWGEAF